MEPILAGEQDDFPASLETLWRRRDLVLVATGSLVCLRAVYQSAKVMGALSRFRYAVLRAADYVLGTAEDEIRRAVLEAAALSGARVVVIYLSCLDILTRLDFDDLEDRLSAQTGCVVKCFFRGPLAKTDAIPHESAAAILAGLPPEAGEVRAGAVLPPPMGDIAGVSDLLRGEGAANVLVTPSGCRGALTRLDMVPGQSGVFAALLHPEDYIFGMEDTMAAEVEMLTREGRYREINLLSSPVPAFMALREEEVLSAASDDVLRRRSFSTDGFQDAVSGAAAATLFLVQEAATMWREETETVLVVGYSALLCGDFAPLREAADDLASLGYGVCWAGRDALPQRPALLWVVSAAGMSAAQWLRRHYGIPAVTRLPLGEAGRAAWLGEVRRALSRGAAGAVPEERTTVRDRTQRFLLIGDPMAMRAIGAVLRRYGFGKLRYAAYTWTKETAELFRQANGDEALLCFQSKEELQRRGIWRTSSWRILVFVPSWEIRRCFLCRMASCPVGKLPGRAAGYWGRSSRRHCENFCWRVHE